MAMMMPTPSPILSTIPKKGMRLSHDRRPSLHSVFLLLPLLAVLPVASSLEDDLFYFTSFANVKEWAQVYNTCSIDFNYQYGLKEIYYLHLEDADGKLADATKDDPLDKKITLVLSLDEEKLPNTLSPIAIKHSETMCLTRSTNRSSCTKALKLDKAKEEVDIEEVLKVFNNPPPPLGSYGVSYGFQKNKECAITNDYSPCYVNPQFGRIRGVVLTANRRQLKEIREQFTVEDPNQFISILDGGNQNERQFNEAIFMGSSEPVDCKSERSSHTLDGKCYPMEIYMYFVDETIPTMAMTTIVVVQVEFSDHENPQLRPIVNAVSKLYDQERIYLPKNDDLTRDERMFHHKGPSTVFRHPHNPNDTDYFYIPSSIDVENLVSAQMDHFERVLTFKAKTQLLHEKFTEAIYQERDLIRTTVFATGINVLFTDEKQDDPKDPKKLFPEYVDPKKELTAQEFTLPDITIAKLRVLRYMVSESYNREVTYYMSLGSKNEYGKDKKDIPLLEGHWPGEKEGLKLDESDPEIKEFTDALKQFLEHREDVDPLLIDKRAQFTYEERIAKLAEIRAQIKKFKDFRADMFKKLPAFILAVCKLTPCSGWTKDTIISKGTWHDNPKKKDFFGKYPRFVRNQMDLGQTLAVNRLEKANNGWEQDLEGVYREMGFKEAKYTFSLPDPLYIGKENEQEIDLTFGNVYIVDKYINRQLRNFLSKKDTDHIFRYHDYKKKEARTGKLHNPPRNILLGNLEMKAEELDKLKKLEPPSVSLMNKFQVSWLFPKGGGYYRYKGSSPVPPCYGAEDVIVFRKPIKASRQQIQVLTTIPTSHLKARDIFNTFGVRTTKRTTKNTEAKNIYFEPRNHQFLVGDGFHENSVLEYQRRKKNKAKGGAGSNRPSFIIHTPAVITYSLIVNLIH